MGQQGWRHGRILCAFHLHARGASAIPPSSQTFLSLTLYSVTCFMHAQDPDIVPHFVQIQLASRRRSPQAAQEPKIPTCVVLSLQKLMLKPSLQVYPTTVRSLGMGVVNSFSRIGGLLSPFVAVALVQVCALPQNLKPACEVAGPCCARAGPVAPKP